MNRTKINILFVLSFIAAIQFYNPLIGYAEQYICVAEHVVGFGYDKFTKKWEGALFSQKGKYVISECSDKEGYFSGCSYKVTKVGAGYFCDCKGFNVSGSLLCECIGGIGEFKFNKKTGRYLYSYLFGYWNDLEDTKEGNNTPYIEIGICSPF